jgi:hypothetical protein
LQPGSDISKTPAYATSRKLDFGRPFTAFIQAMSRLARYAASHPPKLGLGQNSVIGRKTVVAHRRDGSDIRRCSASKARSPRSASSFAEQFSSVSKRCLISSASGLTSAMIKPKRASPK